MQDPHGHLCKDKFRGDALGSGLCANARKTVTGFLLVGFAHEEADIGKFVGFTVQFGS
jgi:hypothetical protein